MLRALRRALRRALLGVMHLHCPAMPIHIHIQNQSYLKHFFLRKAFLRNAVLIPGIPLSRPFLLSTGGERTTRLRRCPGRVVMLKRSATFFPPART